MITEEKKKVDQRKVLPSVVGPLPLFSCDLGTIVYLNNMFKAIQSRKPTKFRHTVFVRNDCVTGMYSKEKQLLSAKTTLQNNEEKDAASLNRQCNASPKLLSVLTLRMLIMKNKSN